MLQLLHIIDLANQGSPKGPAFLVALKDGKQYPVIKAEFRPDPTVRFNEGKPQLALTLGLGKLDDPFREPPPADAPVKPLVSATGAKEPAIIAVSPEITAQIISLQSEVAALREEKARLNAQIETLSATRHNMPGEAVSRMPGETVSGSGGSGSVRIEVAELSRGGGGGTGETISGTAETRPDNSPAGTQEPPAKGEEAPPAST